MKIARTVCCLFLLMLVMVGVVATFQPVFAQEEKITLEATYPKIESSFPGANFEFTVALKYKGSQTRTFDLRASGPPGWTVYITPGYESTRISAIRLEPNKEFPDQVKVVATPPVFGIPEPKEYKVTLEVSAGTIKGSVELTSVLTASYRMDLTPTNERYNTTATAGRDSIYSIRIDNSGSGVLTNIKFSSDKPEGWAIDFKPEKIDSLSAGSFQTIDVNIKPAAKTIAGDYQISLAADSTQTIKNIDIRLTVETPTVWGWVGVIIILLVIAGVTFVFMRFSRR